MVRNETATGGRVLMENKGPQVPDSRREPVEEPIGQSGIPAHRRRTRVRAKDDALYLDVPAPGLDLRQAVRTAAMVAAGIAALFFALVLPGGAVGGAGRVIIGLGGLFLLVTGACSGLRAFLDSTVVCIKQDGLEVTHSFPLRRTVRVGRNDFHGVLIGRHGLVERGFTCNDWRLHGAELVIPCGGKTVYFGEGLPAAEQEWLKQVVENRLPPVPAPESGEGREPVDAEPPERFWRDITRYAAYGLGAALVLLVLLLAAGAGASSVGSVLVLALFLATVALLSYRSYRLEKAAGGWHRAVVKYEAALMDLSFNATDTGQLGRQLPDFCFFRGPRRLYNVAWSESDPGEFMLFDYTLSAHSPLGDGMGCAVRVNKLSHEMLWLKPRLWPALTARLTGMRFPDYPEFQRRYKVVAENEGRARALLGPGVVQAIMSWTGSGPPPQVCIQGGMVGLSMRRRHADSDKAVRQFYQYARTIQEAIVERLRELRS